MRPHPLAELEDLDAVHVWHTQIAQDHVDWFGFENLQSIEPPFGGQDPRVGAKHLLHEAQHVLLVVDNEHGRGVAVLRAHDATFFASIAVPGILRQNVAPPLGLFSTTMVPP